MGQSYDHRRMFLIAFDRGFKHKGGRIRIINFRVSPRLVKIKPLYLTHCTYYLTSNTTRVVQQNYISMLISIKYYYILELGH